MAAINHGIYFYQAVIEGLLANDSNVHADIRTTLSGPSDYDNDGYCGSEIVEAREIDTIGTDGIIKRIFDRMGTKKPVYLSIDIDTLDPVLALGRARRRRGVGRQGSCGRFYVGWKDFEFDCGGYC